MISYFKSQFFPHLLVFLQFIEPSFMNVLTSSGWHSYTIRPLPRKPLWTPQKNCRLQSWTLYKSADCRWISITILCVSFTNSATVGRLKQVQLCNRLIDQSADNITGLKCVKECLILKYKYNPESLLTYAPKQSCRNGIFSEGELNICSLFFFSILINHFFSLRCITHNKSKILRN